MTRSNITCNIRGCPNRGEMCKMCKHWIPSRNSKYYYCRQFWDVRQLCELPKSDCEFCKFYEIPTKDRGRPNMTGTFWGDKTSKAEYMRKRKKSNGRFYIYSQRFHRVHPKSSTKGYLTEKQASSKLVTLIDKKKWEVVKR